MWVVSKFFVVILFLTVLSERAYCERKPGEILVDSLKSELNKPIADSNKVKLLKKISEVYNGTCTDSALAYGFRSLSLANKIGWEKGIASAHMALGVSYEQRADLPSSLDHYFQALVINEHIGNKRGIAAGNWGVGNVYRSQKQYDRAILYTQKALTYYEEAGDKTSVSSLFINLGHIYNCLDKLDSAISLYNRALPVKNELGDTQATSRVLMSIGSIYLKRKNYNQCLSYYFRSLRMLGDNGEPYDISSILGNLGQCYLIIATDSTKLKPDSLISADKRANLATAVKFLDSSLKISKSIGQLDDARITSLDLSEAFEHLGDYQRALSMYKEHVAYKDSLYSSDNTDKIAAIESQRAQQLKDKDIQIAKLRTEVYAICIVFLSAAMIYIAYRLYKQIRSNKQLATDRAAHLKRIASQGRILQHITYIQAHDLRGNVATILGLVKLINSEDPSDPQNKEIIQHIDAVATKLDSVIIDVINEENKLMKEDKE